VKLLQHYFYVFIPFFLDTDNWRLVSLSLRFQKEGSRERPTWFGLKKEMIHTQPPPNSYTISTYMCVSPTHMWVRVVWGFVRQTFPAWKSMINAQRKRKRKKIYIILAFVDNSTQRPVQRKLPSLRTNSSEKAEENVSRWTLQHDSVLSLPMHYIMSFWVGK